jgi:LuxR family maltose regulon positive regulatory protein
MQHEARRRLGEEPLRLVASRASRWYEQQSQLAEAIESALQAQEMTRAADLIEQFSESAYLRDANEFYSLQRWLKQLPEELFVERSALCISYVTTELFVAATHQLTPTLRATLERRLHALETRARAANDQITLGQICSIRALVLWWLDQPSQAEENARQALALLPTHDQWRSNALSILGHLDVFAGRYDSARQLFLQSLALSKSASNQAFTRALTGMLGGTYLEQGLLSQAAHCMNSQLSAARAAADLDDICHGQLALSLISYEHNELVTAQQQTQEVFEIGVQLAHEEHQYHASLMLARIAYARGERDAALNQFLSANAQTSRSFQVYGDVLAWQARFQLASGDLAAIQRWAETRSPRNPLFPTAQYEREELLVARLEIAQGETGNALKRLTQVLDEAQKDNRLRGILEAQILMALASHADKQHERAREILLKTLILARPEDYMRLFLDEGPVMAELLRSILAHTREKALSAYIQRLLQAFASEPGMVRSTTSPDAILLNEPLSQQERRVLRHLAAGRSNPEIARELVVSVNTVRTQVQSIYRKLNVNNRVAASELARELRLL